MPISENEAQVLTEQIRTNVSDLAALMKKAWEGKIWKPLKYESFADWLDGEFHWSHTRGYQLINIATMDETLHAALSLPVDWHVSDRQTRLTMHFGVDRVVKAVTKKNAQTPEQTATDLASTLRAFEKAEAGKKEVTAPSSRATVTEVLPTHISGGQFNHRTALVSYAAFENETEALPTPTPEFTPDALSRVVSSLDSVLTEGEQKLREFDTYLDDSSVTAEEAQIA